MIKIIGLAFYSGRKFYKQRYSDKQLDGLKNRMGEELYTIFMESKAKDEFPIEYFINVNKALSDQFDNGKLDLLKKNGRYSVDFAVSGINRIFFKFGSPEFIINQASNVFQKYYIGGKIKVIDSTKRSIRVELTGFENVKLMEYVCTAIEGWIERAAEISTGKEARTKQEKCYACGDSSCVFLTEW